MGVHRLVFYMAGFDPRGPAREHRDVRQAVADHPCSPDGERVTVGPREKLSPVLERWTVDWQDGQGRVWRTWHGVLRWDDLVRRHWPRSWRQSWVDQFNVYVRAALGGVLGRVRRQAPAAFWLALFPLGVGVATALIWASLMWAVHAQWPGAPGWSWAMGLAGWLWSWRQLSLALDAEWLLRLYGFVWHYTRGELPDVDARLDAWADAVIAATRQEPHRELLLVGHSAGTPLVAALAARLLSRAAEWSDHPASPQLSVLTLGHCLPILAWLPHAQGFRQALQVVVDCPGVTWHDVSAPSDWAAFARVPPWLDLQGPAARAQMSPRFHATLGQAAYDRLLARRDELHLQYLRAPRFGGGYDPVVWMAGPMTLAERHASLLQHTPPA